MFTFKLMSFAGALLAAGVASAGAAPVSALSTQPAIAGVPPAAVTQVQYRGRGWGGGGYYRGGRGWGPGIGLGIGAGIVAGAIIADQAYRPRRGYYYDTYAYDGPYYYPADYRGDPRRICAQHFRSFEWSTGYYTTYSGEKRVCPYLQ